MNGAEAVRLSPAKSGGSGPASPPWLTVSTLSKHFNGVQALREVDFTVAQGEIHGLVGANGAGKTTLIRCLAGLVAPDEGTVTIAGEEVTIGSPSEATRLGLAFMHQELNLVPNFSALQNMLLGAKKRTTLGIINWRATRRMVDGVVRRLGIAFSLDGPVKELTVGEQWMVSIARALVGKAELIAMDEPTASLNEVESDRLHEVTRDLAADGVTILYVSHRLGDVLNLCDSVSVFRDGRRVHTGRAADVDKPLLVSLIVGDAAEPVKAPEGSVASPRSDDRRGETAIELHGVTKRDLVRDVSLKMPRGEIVGLAGLGGAGRTALARLVAGADRMDAGSVLVDDRAIPVRSVADALVAGIAMVPAERRSEGLLLDRSVAFNINIADLRPVRVKSWIPIVHRGKARRRAEEAVKRLDIRARSVEQPVSELSGGNQQKVLIARWLTRPLRLLILDEPSRGVDVTARAEIHGLIRHIAADGAAVLVISSETEELVSVCDRVVVMSVGRVAGELRGAGISQERITQLSYAYTDDRVVAAS